MQGVIIAVFCDSPYHGIEIDNIEYGIDDKVLFHHVYNGNKGRLQKAKLRYRKDGKAFFISGGKRIFMDSVLNLRLLEHSFY